MKYLNTEQYELNRYGNAVENYQNAEYENLVSEDLLEVLQTVLFALGLFVTIYVAGNQIMTHKSVGQLAGLITYMKQLQSPLSSLTEVFKKIQSLKTKSDAILTLLGQRSNVAEEHGSSRDLQSCQGNVSFQGVNFGYPQRIPCLKDVTFTCPQGTTTALVGEAGGGKSSVFRLLFRFFDVSKGIITVDGVNIKELKTGVLQRFIGVVPQNTTLFNKSIMANLQCAKPSATLEEIYHTCRLVGLHDKILKFPQGYNTSAGDCGNMLSGGERQCLAIAHLILKKPPIMLLDEATAALDSVKEFKIKQVLGELAQGRTTLIIAHRLSTIITADQILVVHDGEVVESGTHKELLAKANGRYAFMWRVQQGG